ncbi:MAG TPA: hypothetical protein HA263_07575, partial [Methanoregulaceae archaeon]|nr:hypothetical protein [Methanoregulaceae archaeon]
MVVGGSHRKGGFVPPPVTGRDHDPPETHPGSFKKRQGLVTSIDSSALPTPITLEEAVRIGESGVAVMGEQRVRCAAVLAMLVLLLAVSAGCMGFNYFPARDIVVLKLSENGTQEWASTIDGGQDDAGEDMA